MADDYWSRQRQQQQLQQQQLQQLQQQQQLQQLQQQLQQQQQQREQELHPSPGLLKRPRSDYDHPHSGLPLSYEMHNYLPQQDDLRGAHAVKDTKTIGSAYDRYLQSAKLASGEASGYGVPGIGREVSDGMHSLPPSDPVAMPHGGMHSLPPSDPVARPHGGMHSLSPSDAVAMPRGGMHSLPISDPVAISHGGTIGLDLAANGRGIPFDRPSPVDMMARPGRETLPLPADASSTLYIEGLPPNCTRREVAHIFRPFVGYKEVRLVSKESKHRGGEPVIISFVDFTTPACAATAMSALQGYKMDEHDPDSAYLRLQFSKYPGPRSGPMRRGGRR